MEMGKPSTDTAPLRAEARRLAVRCSGLGSRAAARRITQFFDEALAGSGFSLAQIGQVYMMFRSRLADLDFGPGPESLEVRLFREDEIPWEELAFRTIARTLRTYFLDRKLGRFPLRVSVLERKPPRGGGTP